MVSAEYVDAIGEHLLKKLDRLFDLTALAVPARQVRLRPQGVGMQFAQLLDKLGQGCFDQLKRVIGSPGLAIRERKNALGPKRRWVHDPACW